MRYPVTLTATTTARCSCASRICRKPTALATIGRRPGPAVDALATVIDAYIKDKRDCRGPRRGRPAITFPCPR